jgi:hypothetical protein
LRDHFCGKTRPADPPTTISRSIISRAKLIIEIYDLT